MKEPELMTQDEIEESLRLWAEYEDLWDKYQARRMRREKRTQWMKTWGLAILAGVLMGEVIWFGSKAGTW